MEGYGYPYPPNFQALRPGEYPDHGDGFGEYYGLRPLNEDSPRRGGPWQWYAEWNSYHYGFENYYRQPVWYPGGYYGQGDWQDCERPSGSKHQRPVHKSHHKRSHSHDSETKSRTGSVTRSRSRSRSRTRSRSKSVSHSRSRSRSRVPSRSCSGSRRQLNLKEPGFLDAFRVMYLTPSKHKKSTTKYLATKKRQDRIHEILKSDGLGSKRWYFYPRQTKSDPVPKGNEVPGTRDNCDQRIKVDGDFLRHYKRSKKYDPEAPISKLKHWEIILYKKLGFIQAV